MKRLTLAAACVAMLAILGTTTATANDNLGHGYSVRHGGGGHAVIGHGFPNRGHGYWNDGFGHSFNRHGYSAHAYPRNFGNPYGHGYSSGYGRGFIPPHGYPAYPAYGHGGDIRLSTPHFGLRIGH